MRRKKMFEEFDFANEKSQVRIKQMIENKYGIIITPEKVLSLDERGHYIVSQYDCNGVWFDIDLVDEYDWGHVAPIQPLIQHCFDGLYRVPDIGVDANGNKVRYDARSHMWKWQDDVLSFSWGCTDYTIIKYRYFTLDNYRFQRRPKNEE